MQPTYIITWKSKSRGSTGRGKALFTREDAERVAKELNEGHPDFLHEPADTGGPAATPALEPERPDSGASSVAAFPAQEEVFA